MKEIIHNRCGKKIEKCKCKNPEVSIIKSSLKWTWWTHRKHGIVMEVTQSRNGMVNLWDKAMLFKWKGTERQFKRDWQPGTMKELEAI